jgi:hypothetical protein
MWAMWCDLHLMIEKLDNAEVLRVGIVALSGKSSPDKG